MHPSSINNMRKIRDQFLRLPDRALVLDVGGRGLTSDRSYRHLFDGRCADYRVADICAGLGVTDIMPGPFTIPFPDQTFDLVVSGQMLEHSCNPFKSVAEMKRVLKIGGYLALIAPSTGPWHDSQDGWRFLKDAFRFIAEDVGGMEIIADWIDETAPDERSARWRDHVFVGKRKA